MHCAFATDASVVDSFKTEISRCKNDSNKVDLYLKFADEYWRVFNDRNFAAATLYTDSALVLSKKINYQNGLARAQFLKGKFAISYNRSFEKATSYLLQSLSIYEQLKDVEGQAACHLQLGVISLSLQNYQDAQFHFKSCIHDKSTSKKTLTTGHYLLAISYSETDAINLAYDHFNTALLGYQELNDLTGILQCETYIGKMLVNMHKHDEALERFHKAIVLADKISDKTLYGRTYSFMSAAFINLNQTDSAIYYGELSLKFGNDWLTRKEAYANLNKAYAVKGNYKSAYFYLEKLQQLNDSVYNSNIIKSIADLRGKFLYEKQLNIQKSNQDKENAQSTLNLERQKLIRNAMLFIAVLLVVLLLVVLNRYRLKKQHNEQITQTYNDLKRTQEQLVQQEKLASLGSLTAGIAHEIKNPLNFVNNFSVLSKNLLDEFMNTADEEERKELATDLKNNLSKILEHGKRADSIVKNMLEHSRSGKVEKQLTDINKLCEEFFNLTYHGMRGSNQKFNCTLKKDLSPVIPKINIISQDISRVLINLFNNAFYAVNEKMMLLSENTDQTPGIKYEPTVTLTTRLVNYQVEISIKDNGSGIPDAVKDKIFDPFFTTKPSGQGTGLGLSLSYDIIKIHGGTLRVNTQKGAFTEFIILLPK
jgi:signal transduction histidine kinase